ncbi:hypothetical protein H9P43_007903 [Blastocladiella emersonii ATCC 22665]|nr:hypothetical protein H9P43_007903 [Blastocladiella emersonii ATCC 22665]
MQHQADPTETSPATAAAVVVVEAPSADAPPSSSTSSRSPRLDRAALSAPNLSTPDQLSEMPPPPAPLAVETARPAAAALALAAAVLPEPTVLSPVAESSAVLDAVVAPVPTKPQQQQPLAPPARTTSPAPSSASSVPRRATVHAAAGLASPGSGSSTPSRASSTNVSSGWKKTLSSLGSTSSMMTASSSSSTSVTAAAASATTMPVAVVEEPMSSNPDDYEMETTVGYGSSATVYCAVYKKTRRRVAIKVIDLDMFERNQIEELRRETQVMSLCKHPNVLRVFTSFVADSKLLIVTPYLAAGSVLDIMKAAYPEGLDETSVATILKQTLQGLDYLHKNGHIHRDVKAGNVLLDDDGTAMLADFGVTASLEAADRKGTRKTFVGTPCWMAPEVMEQASYDFKADVWSFGITAIEMARGHAPLAKYPPIKVLMLTLSNDPPTLDRDATRFRFSKAAKEMVDLCLQRDPTRRPTAEKVLGHPFFKLAKKPSWLVQHLLAGLPPLPERARRRAAQPAAPRNGSNATPGDARRGSGHGGGGNAPISWDFDTPDSPGPSPAALLAAEMMAIAPPAAQQQQQQNAVVGLGIDAAGAGAPPAVPPKETKRGRFSVSDNLSSSDLPGAAAAAAAVAASAAGTGKPFSPPSGIVTANAAAASVGSATSTPSADTQPPPPASQVPTLQRRGRFEVSLADNVESTSTSTSTTTTSGTAGAGGVGYSPHAPLSRQPSVTAALRRESRDSPATLTVGSSTAGGSGTANLAPKDIEVLLRRHEATYSLLSSIADRVGARPRSQSGNANAAATVAAAAAAAAGASPAGPGPAAPLTSPKASTVPVPVPAAPAPAPLAEEPPAVAKPAPPAPPAPSAPAAAAPAPALPALPAPLPPPQTGGLLDLLAGAAQQAASVVRENESLRAENERLRREVEALRRELAAARNSGGGEPSAGAAAVAES